MPRPERVEQAADLIERLLTDPAFRADFRRDPAGACERGGLPGLAAELTGEGPGLETLEVRESRSSLAGVIMAAAAEGVGVVEFARHLHGRDHLSADVARAVGSAFSRSSLRAIQAVAPPDESPRAAAEHSPPGGTDPSADPEHSPPGGTASSATEPALPTPKTESGSAAIEHSAEPQNEVASLLDNGRLELPPGARHDLRAGEVDPRLVSILAHLLKRHEIGLSVIKSGHDQFTSSGSVSNHFYGRALDIASIDGARVSRSNMSALDLAGELAALPAAIRPTEVGAPWLIDEEGFFSDFDHQNHIHVAFDDPPPAGWKPLSHQHPGPVEQDPGAHESALFPAVADPARSGAGRNTVQFLPAVRSEEQVLGQAVLEGGGYPGDDASKEALARWMGARAQEAGLPTELPVMAALVESHLSNLDHGDADSVGFFQMRMSVWNKGRYAGYADDPELQLRWFVNQAVALKEKRIADGVYDFGRDPGMWGEWIADIERPAEQYRGRYQLQLESARELLALPTPVVPVTDPAPAKAEADSAEIDRGHESAQFPALAGKREGAERSTVELLPALGQSDPSLQPAALGGPFPPVASDDMTNTNANGELHGSEFNVASPEGPVGPHGHVHAGYDLFGRAGAPVRSPITGTIVEVKHSSVTSGKVFGGTVKIEGAGGRVWVLRHVDPRKVTEDERVEAGQVVATITRWADGPSHVHIELWKTLDGGYVYANMEDPLVELKRAYSGGSGTPVELDHEPGRGPLGIEAPSRLLHNPRLDLPAGARADLVRGAVDPRLVVVLSRLVERHEIGLSVIKSGHDQFTSSGSVSNHFYGRALDIVSIDGMPVRPSNLAARDVAGELAALPAAIRPTEVGAPWLIDEEGFFSDFDHQNHIHVAFDDPPPAGWKPLSHQHPGPVEQDPGAHESALFPAVADPARSGAGRNTVQFLPAVRSEEQVLGQAVLEGGGYPGDDASKEALARWMGARAQEAGLPTELPVMAALVESHLSNLDHGDADSVGFFQMRMSVWNKGRYAGYADDPELQLRWFVNQAVALKEKRIADGVYDFGRDPGMWGEWIADIERPAEQYRGRYQLQLESARELLGTR